MSKLDEIKKYLTENMGKEKQELLTDIREKFSVTEKSADIYYYQWKGEFTRSKNCKPKEEKKVEIKYQEEEKKEIIIPHDVKSINVDEQEIFKKTRLKMISGKFEGEYGEYEVVDCAVKVGDELIKNESDLENFRKDQIRQFYMMIGEITEILKLVK